MISLFDGLSGTLGRDYDVEPTDVRHTKTALMETGDYDAEPFGIDDIPDGGLFAGIERFQARNGLKTDGLMRPGGETETALKTQLSATAGSNAAAETGAGSTKSAAYLPANDRRKRLKRLADHRRKQKAGAFHTQQRQQMVQNDIDTTPQRSSGDRHTGKLTPILKREGDRRESILSDTKARFVLDRQQDVVPTEPWYESDLAGRAAVDTFEDIIREEAARQDVDPDLVRAVMYAENARGHYFGLAKVAEGLGEADSIFPMNIRPDLWEDLGISEKDAFDPRKNIRSSVTLLKRISDRLDEKSADKIGTLWNSLAKDRVTEFGSYVGDVYRRRPWTNEK